MTFFTDGNITVVPQIRGVSGEVRDIGGFTGLRLDDGQVSK